MMRMDVSKPKHSVVIQEPSTYLSTLLQSSIPSDSPSRHHPSDMEFISSKSPKTRNSLGTAYFDKEYREENSEEKQKEERDV